MRQRKLGQKSVVDAKKLRYPSLPPVNIQILNIEETDPDFYLFDKKVHYVSLNDSIEAEVLAARHYQAKPLENLSKKPVKQILRCCIEK